MIAKIPRIPAHRSIAADTLHSIEAPIRELSGARAVHIVDAPGRAVPCHAHDWPILSVYRAGNYEKTHSEGRVQITGPSVVLHAAGVFHSSEVGASGLEQFDLEFDPAWIELRDLSLDDGLRVWIGGEVTALARQLVNRWSDSKIPESDLRSITRKFLLSALRARVRAPPAWLNEVLEALDGSPPPSAATLAARVGLNAAWLAQAYRSHVGEGLSETINRRRVEKAMRLLRHSGGSAAQIAVDCDFFDQSHMIRVFRRVIGRSPFMVRRELSVSGLPPTAI